MQTHNLKLPKNYRDTASDFYIKVGIGLIAILIILNVTLLVLFVKEIKNNRNALRILQETSKSLALLQDSLGRTDMQKAFVHLADAQTSDSGRRCRPRPPHRRRKRLPNRPLQPPQPAKTVAEPKVQPVKPPAAEPKAPAVPVKAEPQGARRTRQNGGVCRYRPVKRRRRLVWAMAGEYALIGEKESKLLHLFKFQDDRFVLVKSYPCIIGANGEDKKKAGDFATPKGSYFTLRYTPGSALPEIYGEGAFVLNYPNFLDRKDSKNGAGIWIHGHVPGKVIGAGDLVNTKGCIAVSNDNIKELKDLLKPSGTPVSIVDKVTFVKESSRKESLQEIRNFMDAWRQAWESGDTAKYLSYYSKDFINSEGMRFEAFKRHKERVNSGKKFIRVNVDQMAIIFPQEREGQIAVVRFIQKYRSNNFESQFKKVILPEKGTRGMDNFRRVCLLAVAVFLVLCFRFHDLAAEKGQMLPESQTKAYFQETRQELTVHYIRGKATGADAAHHCGNPWRRGGRLPDGGAVRRRQTEQGKPDHRPASERTGRRGGKATRSRGRHEPPFQPPAEQLQPRRQSRQSGEATDRAGGLRPESSPGLRFLQPALDIPQAKSLEMGTVQRHRYGHVPPAERTEAGAGELREAGRPPGQYAESPTGITTSRSTTPIPRVKWSRHKEQKGSLTYYSLYQQQKIALGAGSDEELFPCRGRSPI